MSETKGRYIPALRFHALTRFYDNVVRVSLSGERFKELLTKQADLEPGQRVLDLGCGTATLTILLKRAYPDVTVVGLDPDREILALARKKIDQAGLEVELREGIASAPPFEPKSFDRVVSSLVFHHLDRGDKRRALLKVLELLKPGGELHIADWGKAQNLLMRLAFLPVQILDGFESTSDNVKVGLIPFLEEAGFSSAEETYREMTLFGTLSLYRATRP